MLKVVLKVKNGDMFQDYPIYECNICGSKIECPWPHYSNDSNYHLCVECALREGKFTSNQYVNCVGLYDAFNAGINPKGEIEIWKGNKTPPWERTKRQQRNSPGYNEWRIRVYERDKYKCQNCGQVGGELNAHHIKSFKKYPKLRLDIDNGITLCIKCHKEVHRFRRD